MNNQKREFNDEVCLAIGRSVLDTYNKWTENPKGTHINIPVSIPCKISNQPDWVMNIQCDMPRFVYRTVVDGIPTYRIVSLKEYYDN